MVVFHPHAHEVISGRWKLAELVDRIERREDLHSLDLLAYFQEVAAIGESNVSDYYWPLDQHHTPLGYRLFAEAVADRILELGWTLSDRSTPPLESRVLDLRQRFVGELDDQGDGSTPHS